MRKLASVQIIRDLQPIEGADRIEIAVINNWKVVVAKDVGHKIGDPVVYCEIDSFLPTEPEFEFLRKTSYKKMGEEEGFRLKTIKLRGQVSQGLILPLKDAYQIYQRKAPNLDMGWFEGLDVTDMLGIVKYEPPIPAQLAGQVKGLFPSFISKTDEERVQNLTDEYSEYTLRSDHQFFATEKLDGSSSTFFFNNGEFGVCSRNLELKETDDNTFWKLARSLKLEEKLRDLGRNLALQGELIGEGVQGNPYKIKGQTVKFFNVFDIEKYEKLSFQEFQEIIEKLGLESVPVVSSPFLLPNSVEEMIREADGKSILNPSVSREGLVIRSMDMSISFKAISNNWLLNEEK
jgi:RNA ligase (TIGR02306 family)